jgi:biotin carboxylase
MHVLIIGPYSSGLLYIRAARELGVTLSVMTTNKDAYQLSDTLTSLIDNLIVVEDFNAKALIAAAKKLHVTSPVDGVGAGEEFLVTQTAFVAEALGLPGLNIDKVEDVRNKALMRRRLREARVRIPRFASATSALDLEHVVEHVGFPAVVKPLSMIGSIGVARVDNPVELLAAYDDIVNDHETRRGTALGSEVLVEELLVGTEFSVDGYITHDGQVNIFEFNRYELGAQPHFQVIGYTVCRAEDLPESIMLDAYIQDVVKALDICAGPFHSEVILTSEGPVLVEIANRLPGDHIPLLAERATGVSFAQHTIAALVGMPPPPTHEPIARVGASQFIVAPNLIGQTYRELVGWSEITKHPEVDSASILIEPGKTIPPYQDMRSRLAEVQFHSDTIEKAEAFRQRILETVHVVQ